MVSRRELAEFHSSRFAPVLPEECQTNPGRYGAELAFWLCTRLYEEGGLATSYPVADDVCWYLRYTTPAGEEFSLHCGNLDGTNDRWLIFLRRYGQRFFGRKKPDFERANDLIETLRRVLESEAGISELHF